jgi:hypothetical protein
MQASRRRQPPVRPDLRRVLDGTTLLSRTFENRRLTRPARQKFVAVLADPC